MGTMSPSTASDCDKNVSVWSSDSVISDISNMEQLDGNVSVFPSNVKVDKIIAALSLPTVATYN